MASDAEVDAAGRLNGRASLPFKVRAASKEAQPHKAAHVADPDPKNHWSTSTNAKEWLLLELEEPCLLQQIRIFNKSVIEWEIALGLRYKPESFMKVRTRCEAPRRDCQYITNYAPCRYVRISCLRGNPIAIYSVQLIGISMPGLEPEFQNLVEHLLPQLTSNKLEMQDLYLQLVRDIMGRLAPFAAYLEPELSVNSEGIESTLRLLAMLSGPFYPILMAIDERERMKNLTTVDVDPSKGSQTSLFTVSSNFQAPPRRSRSPVSSQLSVGHALAFRPDVVLSFMKVAYRDNDLGAVCRMVARIFYKITTPVTSIESNGVAVEADNDEMASIESSFLSFSQNDYSSLFGEEFHVEDIVGDSRISALLDISSVEEGLLHFLYASVGKPLLCRRLAEVKPDMLPVLPFIQAILPALRPPSINLMDQPDEGFSAWQSPLVQRALSQVVSLMTTPLYKPLLDGCAGYLSSFSLAHERAACVIIDLCSGPLNSWLPMIVAKIDLAFELVEGILLFIQVTDKGTARARAALIYVMIGLSGHMDEFLPMYKDVKHNLIFVIEILEPYLRPVITPIKNMIAFGDVSTVLTEEQERICSLALDILKAALNKPTILPALETEWRKGDVKPSLLLSILAPQLLLPPDIDSRKVSAEMEEESTGKSAHHLSGMVPLPSVAEEEAATKPELLSIDNLEDPSSFFLPIELKFMNWKILSSSPPDTHDFGQFPLKGEPNNGGEVKESVPPEIPTSDSQVDEQFINLQIDYLQLSNFQERELRAAEFVHFATELHLQDGTLDNHQAAIDAMLLAVECHLNPLFMFQPLEYDEILNKVRKSGGQISQTLNSSRGSLKQTGIDNLFSLEEERDKAVLQILLKAAEWDSVVMEKVYEGLQSSDSFFGCSNTAFGDAGVSIENMIDATTIVRKHQNLLCRFLTVQLQKECDNIREGLLQGLLFILCSSTELSCPPEQVVDIILRAAKQLNVSLHSKIPTQKLRNTISMTSLSLRRQWVLLCRLVTAASGGQSVGEDEEFGTSEVVYFKELVPASAWVSKIAEFSSSSFPIVRFIGWKGLARFAKTQQKTGSFLASDLNQLSFLLSVFADDLMSSGLSQMKWKGLTQEYQADINMTDTSEQYSFCDASNFLYPELDLICPSLRKEFAANALLLLGGVCLQLKCVPASAIPDLLSWFSEICYHPYFQEKGTSSQCSMMAKGYSAANIRFVILKLLEVILVEHMESVMPELPRVIGVVLSLCDSAYCDIFLLDSVLKALKPVISYGVASLASVELQMDDSGILTFESLCFNALMEKLQSVPISKKEETSRGAFLLFLSGAVLSDVSVVKRLQLMHLLTKWAKFTSYSVAPSYYNYLFAFQKIFEAYQWMLEKSMNEVGFSLEMVAMGLKRSPKEVNSMEVMLDSIQMNHNLIKPPEAELSTKEILSNDQHQDNSSYVANESYGLSVAKTECTLFSDSYDLLEFGKCINSLLLALGPSLETAWKLHPDLSSKITKSAACCLMTWSLLNKGFSVLSNSMQTNVQQISDLSQIFKQGRGQTIEIYRAALDTVCQVVLTFQKSNCWQVGSCTIDFLFTQPLASEVLAIIPSLFTVLQFQCIHAPRVTWRQCTAKWLSQVISTIAVDSDVPTDPISEIFKILLEHKEPEQRMAALQQLDRLAKLDDPLRGSIYSGRENIANKEFICAIVTSTWDTVSSMAAWDLCASIRRQAVEVLIDFVPLAQSEYMQRLLSSADAFLPGLAKVSYTMSDTAVIRMSLALLSRVCLYSTMEDINMIPSRVWSSLEALSKQKPGTVLAEAEQAVCVALLQLRDKGEDAKQAIDETLAKNNRQLQETTDIANVRESVLKVFARINSIRMVEDAKLATQFQESKDLEEAEIELELVKHERDIEGKASPLHTFGNNILTPDIHIPVASRGKDRQERLKELRCQIQLEEYSTMRAEILARRERQKVAQRQRQLALEGSTIREIELLQDLDREKAAEAEREIERHQILERERAKTRELRHSLDLETEKRTQRELQRELEQRESATVRPARREFAGSASGRPRERYRERDSGRPSQDSRSSSGVTRENSTTPPATPTAGSRPHGR